MFRQSTGAYEITPQILSSVHQIIHSQIPIFVASFPTLVSQDLLAPELSLFSKCLIQLCVSIHIKLFVKDVLLHSTSTPGKLLFILQYPIQILFLYQSTSKSNYFLCKNFPDSLSMSNLSVFEFQNILFMPRLHYYRIWVLEGCVCLILSNSVLCDNPIWCSLVINIYCLSN